MGDRTWAKIEYPIWAHAFVSKFIDDEGYDDGLIRADDGTPVLGYVEEQECNNAEHSMQARLEEKRIPYDKYWGRGDNYGPGEMKVRYKKNGRMVKSELYDEEYEDVGRQAVLKLAKADSKSALKVLESIAKSVFYLAENLRECKPVTAEHRKLAVLSKVAVLTERKEAA